MRPQAGLNKKGITMSANLITIKPQFGKIEKALMDFAKGKPEDEKRIIFRANLRTLFSEIDEYLMTQRETAEAIDNRVKAVRDLVDEYLEGGAA